MLVSAANLLVTVARIRSPLRMRISLPGSLPLYAQVRTETPPRSISVSAGAKAMSTAGDADGFDGSVFVGDEQPAATPAAAAVSARNLRRLIMKPSVALPGSPRGEFPLV